MKRIILFFTFVIGFTFILPSCKKYEEGPALSLRSKKERISNTWVIESAFRNNVNISDAYKDFILTMNKNGSATLQLKVIVFSSEIFLQTDGTWTLEEFNENLRLNFENNDYDRYYEIIKLKENELWLREIGYNGDELKLRPR
jgi:hypothetical protein